MGGPSVVSSEESEADGTTGGLPRLRDDETTLHGGDDDTSSPASDEKQSRTLSQLEISKKSYYDARAKTEKKKASLFTFLKWAFGVFLTVVAVFWGYNMTNIAEPIGGLKAKVENLERTADEQKAEIRDLRDRQIDTEAKMNAAPQTKAN